MSEALTVIDGNQALAQGGIGLENSGILRIKPATIELVQRTTKKEGAIPGKFRNTANPDMSTAHVDEMRCVLLTKPQEQREYYGPGEFSNENKLCFSLDNKVPHPRAKEPQALQCENCPKGEVNWMRWRETKLASDVPPCHLYYHLVLVDRTTQLPYYFNVKKSGVGFLKRDIQNVRRTLQMMLANVRIENQKIDVANAQLPQGAAPRPHMPLPNIFDATFTFYIEKLKDGSAFVPRIKNVVALRSEDRADFGNLYVEFVNNRAAAAAAYAEQQVEDSVNDAPVTREVETVLKSGENEPITI